METPTNNSGSHEAIFKSIRSNLALSRNLDALEEKIKHQTETASGSVSTEVTEATSIVDLFKASLEAVDGHCLIVHDDSELLHELTKIMRNLRQTKLSSLRVAVSDSSDVQRLVGLIELDLDEVAVTPSEWLKARK